MEFFEARRPSLGPSAVDLDLGGLSLGLHGLDEDLAGILTQRYGPFAVRASGKASDLRVSVRAEDRDYFIEPPRTAQLNPLPLVLDGNRVRLMGHRLAGWFDIRGGPGEILLARGDYEPAERAIENYLRAAVAWLAFHRGGAFIHAASIVLNDRGYLFYGPSGAGKSSLAAVNRRGSVVSDDLSLLLPGERGLELVGSPFRGTYRGGPPVVGRFRLAAGFWIVRAVKASVVDVPRSRAWAGVVVSLPFVNEALLHHPELLDTLKTALADVPLAYLQFSGDESYWKALNDAGL